MLSRSSGEPAPGDRRAGTQERFARSTLAQCDDLVRRGVDRCADWFSRKWAECAKAIKVPVIKQVLCLPMKFSFLCNVVRVMTGWCKQHVPVERNFGQLYDHLNNSMNLLNGEFTSKLVVKEHERQGALAGQVPDGDFSRNLRASFRRLADGTRHVMDVLRLVMSFAFLSVFAQCLGYVRQFRGDLYFDNMYLTKYFGIIDRRRKSLGKLHLLPLTASERRKLVDPWSLKIHLEEVKQVLSSVFQVLSALLLAAVLLTVDWSVFRVLDAVSKHTHITFNFSSSQEVNIKVDGASMVARLLRKSFSAFNSSSGVRAVSDNQRCVTPPASLPASVYVKVAYCLLLAALFSCLQVYANRLRRVIAAFYHPRVTPTAPGGLMPPPFLPRNRMDRFPGFRRAPRRAKREKGNRRHCYSGNRNCIERLESPFVCPER